MDCKLVPLILAMLLVACSGSSQHEAVEPPPSVRVISISASTVKLSDTFPGRVMAFRTAEIRPQVGGIVRQRLFEQGTEVRAGQKLFQLDPTPFKAEYAVAEAALQHASATLARVTRQAERLQPLIGADAISRQAYDDAVSERELAAASVAQARAALERKRFDLASTTVRAPIAGRIGQELVSEGALVSQTDSLPMARIQQIDQVYVDVRQPASMLLTPGARRSSDMLEVTIHSPQGQNYVASARILFSDMNVDANTGDTLLRLQVDNKDHALMPGMFVQARITHTQPTPALLLPQQAAQRRADGNATVWTLDKTGKANQRTVKVGAVIHHQYVVLSGLNEGDTVVVEGQDRLREGQPAQAQPWKSAASVPPR